MTEPPNQQTLYPLVLALSVALFIHVVLATLANAWLSLPAPDEPAPVVSVRIAPSGGRDQPSPAQPQPAPRATEQHARPKASTESSAPTADATTRGETDRTREPEASPAGEPREQNPERQPPAQHDAPASPAPPASSAGTDSPSSARTDTLVTRLSRKDRRERSDYEIALWERIAREVEYTRLLEELKEPREVILDLRLMVNGALRRVRVNTSSGMAELDGVARQAALAATPFPEPPEGRRRFSVRLVFEPAGPE